MTRNIMTGEGIKPVKAMREFEVCGIKMFTYYSDVWEEWHVIEVSSGLALTWGHTEEDAIERARARIANVGPEKVIESICSIIARCGVANEEVKA